MLNQVFQARCSRSLKQSAKMQNDEGQNMDLTSPGNVLPQIGLLHPRIMHLSRSMSGIWVRMANTMVNSPLLLSVVSSSPGSGAFVMGDADSALDRLLAEERKLKADSNDFHFRWIWLSINGYCLSV
ncbi:hypothetical protein L1049_020430 [Liquidambar formosana]|uniref:Uncharacterized protein n=1 Tax=Liquidambar formosana TaxID=63359 RepID=A0AAP0S760_LIQFO